MLLRYPQPRFTMLRFKIFADGGTQDDGDQLLNRILKPWPGNVAPKWNTFELQVCTNACTSFILKESIGGQFGIFAAPKSSSWNPTTGLRWFTGRRENQQDTPKILIVQVQATVSHRLFSTNPSVIESCPSLFVEPNFPQQCTHEIPRISMSFSVFWLNSQLSSAIHPVLPHPQRPAHQWGIVEGHHAVAQGGNQSQGPHGGVPMELNVFTWSRYKNDDLQEDHSKLL